MTAPHAARKGYVWVWALLALLTVAEVFAVDWPLSRKGILAILAALSAWKAYLVAFYFMHLKSESRWLVFAASVPVLVTAITVILLLTDTPALPVPQ